MDYPFYRITFVSAKAMMPERKTKAMNIYAPKLNYIETKLLDESAVYSKDGLFFADYLDNGCFNVCVVAKDLYIGIFKFISGKWAYLDDFGTKFLESQQWDCLATFLLEFQKSKGYVKI